MSRTRMGNGSGKRTIRQLRQEHVPQWSQTDLSVALHVTVNTVQSWEANRAEPKLTQMQAIMDVFSVSWEEVAWPVKIKKLARVA